MAFKSHVFCAAGLALAVLTAEPAFAQTPAKELFSAKDLPTATPTASHGFYSEGCISGAVALPTDGATWQAMRLSRNRRWGHPRTIALLERLSKEAAAEDGWPGLLVGDISQPRGGPMLFGHASHQVGLDADIWLTPMPDRRLSFEERENKPFVSVLEEGTNFVDDRKWTPAHKRLIKRAAEYDEVQRIFVHPGIKKKLCETAGSERAWLNKVRPMWGHDSHFHIRLFCQPGSPGCEPQKSTGTGDGCGATLDWWYNVGLKPAPPSAEPPKPEPPTTLADLPNVCRAVLGAQAVDSAKAATFEPGESLAMAAGMMPSKTAGFPALPETDVPVPGPRPLTR